MKALGYVRVSSQEQADSGLSLAAQAERIAAYCQAQNWTLCTVYQDAGESAKDLNRPALQDALAALEAGEGDVLVALKLDRLTRSVVDLHALIERCDAAGARLASVSDSFDTTSAGGRLVVNVLAVVSQWEREAAIERTVAALQQKQAQGEWVGLPPYGFSIADGRLVENRAELDTIQRMKRWRRRGLSYRGIARRLDGEGVVSRRGSWNDRTVRRLVNEHLSARKAKYLNGSTKAGAAKRDGYAAV